LADTVTVLNSQRLSAFLSIIVKQNAEWIEVRWIVHAHEFVLGSSVMYTTSTTDLMLVLIGHRLQFNKVHSSLTEFYFFKIQ